MISAPDGPQEWKEHTKMSKNHDFRTWRVTRMERIYKNDKKSWFPHLTGNKNGKKIQKSQKFMISAPDGPQEWKEYTKMTKNHDFRTWRVTRMERRYKKVKKSWFPHLTGNRDGTCCDKNHQKPWIFYIVLLILTMFDPKDMIFISEVITFYARSLCEDPRARGTRN